MPRPYAEVNYTLTDLLIAAYNITADTFGTPESIDDGQMVVYEPEADNDQMRGYGVITRLLSVPIGAKVTLGAGGVDRSGMVILAGTTNTSSGTTPNQVTALDFPAGGAGLPYFGFIGVGPTDDGGTVVLGAKACKLDKHPKFTLDGNTNKFNIWETDGYSIPIGGKLHRVKFHETAANWVKPTTGANFLAFFTTL